jgi:putative hydrolase of the HAD superfamily
MSERPRVVFFDAGETLFRAHPSPGEIYRKVAFRYGCQATAAELEHAFRNVWKQHDGDAHRRDAVAEKAEKRWWYGLVREVFRQVGEIQNFDRYFDEVYDLFGSPESWRVGPGIIEVLEALRGDGMALGIVSNWDQRLFSLCAGLEIAQYFDIIIASGVVGASKPSPEIFREALRQARVAPRETVHVGDSLEDDILGAARVGIRPIWLAPHHDPRELDVYRAQNITVIQDIRDLLSPTNGLLSSSRPIPLADG